MWSVLGADRCGRLGGGRCCIEPRCSGRPQFARKLLKEPKRLLLIRRGVTRKRSATKAPPDRELMRTEGSYFQPFPRTFWAEEEVEVVSCRVFDAVVRTSPVQWAVRAVNSFPTIGSAYPGHHYRDLDDDRLFRN